VGAACSAGPGAEDALLCSEAIGKIDIPVRLPCNVLYIMGLNAARLRLACWEFQQYFWEPEDKMWCQDAFINLQVKPSGRNG